MGPKANELRKNALNVGSERSGRTAAVIDNLPFACRCNGINPERFLTQLLTNLLDTPLSRLDEWLPDERKKWNGAALTTDVLLDHILSARLLISATLLNIAPRKDGTASSAHSRCAVR